MSDTLGSLVDKLSIVNVKLFHVQDIVHEAAESGDGLDPETVSKLHGLNMQRSALMREIDETFADSVRSGKVAVDPHIKLV